MADKVSVAVVTQVFVNGSRAADTSTSGEFKTVCEGLDWLRGEARDQASQAIDNAKDKFKCPKEKQEGGEDRDARL